MFLSRSRPFQWCLHCFLSLIFFILLQPRGMPGPCSQTLLQVKLDKISQTCFKGQILMSASYIVRLLHLNTQYSKILNTQIITQYLNTIKITVARLKNLEETTLSKVVSHEERKRLKKIWNLKWALEKACFVLFYMLISPSELEKVK